MEKFAEYGFNKSHSAEYADIAYQTAYLKAHYPVEFMAALLTEDMENTDKVIKNINEIRNMEIAILPPDINESSCDFTVHTKDIELGELLTLLWCHHHISKGHHRSDYGQDKDDRKDPVEPVVRLFRQLFPQRKIGSTKRNAELLTLWQDTPSKHCHYAHCNSKK